MTAPKVRDQWSTASFRRKSSSATYTIAARSTRSRTTGTIGRANGWPSSRKSSVMLPAVGRTSIWRTAPLRRAAWYSGFLLPLPINRANFIEGLGISQFGQDRFSHLQAEASPGTAEPVGAIQPPAHPILFDRRVGLVPAD